MVKNLPASVGNAGDAGLIPGWGRSPGEGNGNPLQYSCLGDPMDRGTMCSSTLGSTYMDKAQNFHCHLEARLSS